MEDRPEAYVYTYLESIEELNRDCLLIANHWRYHFRQAIVQRYLTRWSDGTLRSCLRWIAYDRRFGSASGSMVHDENYLEQLIARRFGHGRT